MEEIRSRNLQSTAEATDPDHYKLDTVFHNDQVIHHTSQRNWWRPGEAGTETWVRIKRLGDPLGKVWLEEAVTTKQLRVVKKKSLKPGQNWGQPDYYSPLDSVSHKQELLSFISMRDYEHLFVRFFGWFEDRDLINYTMEYLELGDLGKYMREYGPLGSDVAKDIITHLLRGLVVLHKRGFCHGNLNPTNILISSLSPFCVKISDFGFSGQGREAKINLYSCWRLLSEIPHGRYMYMAPEIWGLLPGQTMGHETVGDQYLQCTNAVDIWALGCLVYEIFTGKIPFSGPSTKSSRFRAGPWFDHFESFCLGESPLPTCDLEKSQVSEAGIKFIRGLLIAEPRSRVSAVDALRSSWLGVYEINRYKLDTKFDLEKNCVEHTNGERALKASGTWLGVWEEVGMIGRGGFGSVWLEKKLVEGRKRAVKRIPRDKRDGIDLSRELKALMEVRQCPDSFVQFFGWYENDHNIFLAMEYIEKGDLDRYLKARGRQTEEDTKEITRQLVVALAFLHREQICHRDLKPENVLIASESPIRIKLSDFGISKFTIHTKLHTRIGTQGYMAPELLGISPEGKHRGNIYTNSVDMWALGCLVYKIFTLETPFQEKPFTQTIIPGTTQPETCRASTDMDLLYKFCMGGVDLPIGPLEESEVSNGGIQFIKDLLVADPEFRISAMDAMRSRWMSGLPVDQHEVIRSQFSTLGVYLTLRVTEGLILQWMRSSKVGVLGPPIAKDPGTSTRTELRWEGLHGVEPLALPSIMVESPGDLMHAAASEGYKMIVDIMVYIMPTSKEGVDVRVKGWTALQSAARGGHTGVVKLLLEKNAKVNASPGKEQGRTALQAAAEGGHIEVVRILLDKGATINAKPSYNAGRGALQAAAQGGSLEVVKLLLEMGASVNDPPCKIQGRMALQAAAENGKLEIVRLLVEKGAKIDAGACDIKGRTALQAAAENGHLEIARFLLERGADANTDPCDIEGRTALQAAVENGHLDVVRLLLQNDADPNAEPCPEEGTTALSAAIKGGYSEVEEVLRTAGANLCDD